MCMKRCALGLLKKFYLSSAVKGYCHKKKEHFCLCGAFNSLSHRKRHNLIHGEEKKTISKIKGAN